ncbi:MAG: NAD(P)H-dependent oxidoreductase [Pseudomonas sp.]|uniref:NAD(P)H-dependent oxidoreductase n=1 Tax=Pseudomonas abieticivorans TaxID=2931382 RepID=UPI0020C12E47|nr:NAD(P)H-dependent oxidoreductase [Pseudomonas sp. PIA16]MDE1166549.1 NAD(P)H-dependent oxidoreductase [Pseudomonas sp.]
MKLLHIDSSILGDNSASRALSRSVVESFDGAQVTYRDLAAEALTHFSAATLAAGDVEAKLSADTLSEFLAADVVVIGAPMYNFSIPTQLKAWVDRICVAGQTFRYTEAGPEGLCGGKKVVIVSTSGGIHAGLPTGIAHEEYLKVLLGFIGVTDIEIVRAQGLAYGDEVRSKALADAHKQIEAKLFAAA